MQNGMVISYVWGKLPKMNYMSLISRPLFHLYCSSLKTHHETSKMLNYAVSRRQKLWEKPVVDNTSKHNWMESQSFHFQSFLTDVGKDFRDIYTIISVYFSVAELKWNLLHSYLLLRSEK